MDERFTGSILNQPNDNISESVNKRDKDTPGFNEKLYAVIKKSVQKQIESPIIISENYESLMAKEPAKTRGRRANNSSSPVITKRSSMAQTRGTRSTVKSKRSMSKSPLRIDRGNTPLGSPLTTKKAKLGEDKMPSSVVTNVSVSELNPLDVRRDINRLSDINASKYRLMIKQRTGCDSNEHVDQRDLDDLMTLVKDSKSSETTMWMSTFSQTGAKMRDLAIFKSGFLIAQEIYVKELLKGIKDQNDQIKASIVSVENHIKRQESLMNAHKKYLQC